MEIKRVLNAYAGIGGNRKKWKDVDVVAVEHNKEIGDVYQSFFPQDTLVVADAHEWIERCHKTFDFVWSSPPCQSHSQMMKATRHEVAKYPDMNLYAEIIFLKNFFRGKWVVENVKPYYQPPVPPTQIIGRHYFWSNFPISDFKTSNIKGFIKQGTQGETEAFKKWLGLEYPGNLYYEGNHCPGQVLRNAVHPDLGLHILNCARNYVPPIQEGLFKDVSNK